MHTLTRDDGALRRARPRRPRRSRRVGQSVATIVAGVLLLAACMRPGPAPVGAGTIMGPSELTAAQITACVENRRGSLQTARRCRHADF